MPAKNLEAMETLISLLDVLGKDTHEQCIRSLSKNIGASKSTVHRMLQELSSKSWAYQDIDSKNYYIGLSFLCFADEWRRNLPIIKLIDSELHDLAKKSGQTITLSVLHKEKALCIHRIDAPRVLRIASRVGNEYPLYAGASGKTVLACSDRKLKENIISGKLTSFTPYTVTDPDILKKQLSSIYANKYCLSSEEIDAGISAMATPIFYSSKRLAFVVTMSGAHYEIVRNEDSYKKLLMQSAKLIQLKIASASLN